MQTTTHTSHVPPGFRFHPTDEELINFYLKKKVTLDKFDLDHVIKEVDLNKLEPWDLREKCKVDASHQTEWYFFSHKDKKYPTGTRTNRATAAGFWKATGRDKAVHSSCQRIGMRKTLVFYKGRAPHGQKTDWIMHEYRLEDGDYNNASSSKGSSNNEDGWVVCRVFKKRSHQEKTHHHSCSASASLSDEEQSSPAPAQHSKNRNPDTTQSIKSKTTSLVACKQEIIEETAPPANPSSSFLQLPQLESPKVPSLTNDIADLKRIFAENGPSSNNNKKPLDHLHSNPSHLETQGGGGGVPPRGDLSFIYGASRMPFFATEEDLNEFLLDNGHLALQEGWSLYDIMARSYHVPAPGDHLNTYQGDFTPCLSTPATTRQPPPFEYPSSCEVELWNFTR